MKKIIAVAIAFIATFSLHAQSRVGGQVTDASGSPLFGVNLVLGEQAFGTSTDLQGRFLLKGLVAGPTRLRVSHVGYQMIDSTIVFSAGENVLDLKLREQSYLMREAEVTAVRAGDRAAVAKSTITREQLEKMNIGVDLPILLDLQPSVVTTTDAGTGIGYTGIRIRGTDATRINVTLNGVAFNDAEGQGTFFVDLPDFATSVEDIEVQRGVGTSTNGPGAFGASINMRTAPVREKAFGEVGAFGGSYNTQRYYARFGTGLSKSGFSLDGRLSTITSDGYIDRATSDLKSYFLQGAWIGKTRSLRFITFGGHEVTYQAWGGVPREVIDTDRTYNVYSYANEVDDYDQKHYQLLFDQRLGANTMFNITGFRVDGAGFFENYETGADLNSFGIGTQVLGTDTITNSDLVQRRWLDNTLLGANASVTHVFSAHKLIVGGSYSDYRGDHFGEVIWSRIAGDSEIGGRYYNNDARKTDMNVFAKLAYAVNSKLDLFGDVQLRKVAHDFLGFDDQLDNVTQNAAFTFFNPKAGLSWSAHEGGRVYGSVAMANREPNRSDLIETTPQSRPRSEQLIDYELGYERRSGRHAVGVNGYYMDYVGQLVLTGELNDVGAALRTNVPESYRAGMELTWAAQLLPRMLWKGNATLSRNRIRNYTEFVDDWDNGGQVEVSYDEAPIAFSPEMIAASELGINFWKMEGKGRGDVTLITKYVGEQYLDNSGSDARKLEAYVVNDLRFNVSLSSLFKIERIDFNLTVRNIFSELYASNGWSYSYFADGRRQEFVGLYPQAPLNVLGGVVLRF